MTIYDKYETVVGLEVHVQLHTQTKAFCADNASFGGEPNTHISAISLAYPGTLPRLNKKAIEYAVKLGLALGCKINQRNCFDRKNYFYADLPKGYQITQDKLPICVGGSVEIEVHGIKKHIRIHHIHLEEDAGKSIHDLDDTYSFIDLNRAGVPLLEIVSEPDLRSADEVAAYMESIRHLVRWLEISDGNMEQGSMRGDCNVSVRIKGESKYGERCEIKNVNSMRFAKRAVEYEAKRQIELIEAGGRVRQQTLHFDSETGLTAPLRDKEDAHDYRYFPEPDLPPVILTDDFMAEIRQQMPPFPATLRQEFIEKYHLSEYDANLLTEEKEIALFFVDAAQKSTHYKAIANFFINKIRPYLHDNKLHLADFPLNTDVLIAFIDLMETDKISHATGYQKLFPALLAQPNTDPIDLAQSLNLLQNSDNQILTNLAQEILAAYPEKVKEYKKGKKGLIGFFMGELMKRSKGQANPKNATTLLENLLK